MQMRKDDIISLPIDLSKEVNTISQHEEWMRFTFAPMISTRGIYDL